MLKEMRTALCSLFDMDNDFFTLEDKLVICDLKDYFLSTIDSGLLHQEV